jgi:hypothetical protein
MLSLGATQRMSLGYIEGIKEEKAEKGSEEKLRNTFETFVKVIGCKHDHMRDEASFKALLKRLTLIYHPDKYDGKRSASEWPLPQSYEDAELVFCLISKIRNGLQNKNYIGRAALSWLETKVRKQRDAEQQQREALTHATEMSVMDESIRKSNDIIKLLEQRNRKPSNSIRPSKSQPKALATSKDPKTDKKKKEKKPKVLPNVKLVLPTLTLTAPTETKTSILPADSSASKKRKDESGSVYRTSHMQYDKAEKKYYVHAFCTVCADNVKFYHLVTLNTEICSICKHSLSTAATMQKKRRSVFPASDLSLVTHQIHENIAGSMKGYLKYNQKGEPRDDKPLNDYVNKWMNIIKNWHACKIAEASLLQLYPFTKPVDVDSTTKFVNELFEFKDTEDYASQMYRIRWPDRTGDTWKSDKGNSSMFLSAIFSQTKNDVLKEWTTITA